MITAHKIKDYILKGQIKKGAIMKNWMIISISFLLMILLTSLYANQDIQNSSKVSYPNSNMKIESPDAALYSPTPR